MSQQATTSSTVVQGQEGEHSAVVQVQEGEHSAVVQGQEGEHSAKNRKSRRNSDTVNKVKVKRMKMAEQGSKEQSKGNENGKLGRRRTKQRE